MLVDLTRSGATRNFKLPGESERTQPLGMSRGIDEAGDEEKHQRLVRRDSAGGGAGGVEGGEAGAARGGMGD